MARRKKKKGWPRRKQKKDPIIFEREEIWCSICKDNSVISWSHVKEIICSDCLARQMLREDGLPNKTQRVTFKRGWNLRKKFVAPNGDVYSYGELVKKGKKNDRNSAKASKKN